MNFADQILDARKAYQDIVQQSVLLLEPVTQRVVGFLWQRMAYHQALGSPLLGRSHGGNGHERAG